MTPCSYSDIPDSPGELFAPPPAPLSTQRVAAAVVTPPFAAHTFNSARRGAKWTSGVCTNPPSLNSSQLNQRGLNECSVLTVDSNPSKSNDITVIERTVLASANHNNMTHLTGHEDNTTADTSLVKRKPPHTSHTNLSC